MDNEGREGNNMDAAERSLTDDGKSSTTNGKYPGQPIPFTHIYKNYVKAYTDSMKKSELISERLTAIRKVKEELREELSAINAIGEEIKKFIDRSKQI